MWSLVTYAGEEQRAKRRVDEIQNPVVHEDAKEPKEQQDDETHEQHAVTGSEVILGLWLDRKQIYNSDRSAQKCQVMKQKDERWPAERRRSP